MSVLQQLYRSSLALLTDLYELTMAYGYWKLGRADEEANFHLVFRKHPFRGGYTLAAGLEYVIDYVCNFRFNDEDVEYLAGLTGSDDNPLFDTPFLEYLSRLALTCDIDAVPEGTVVFPQEPLLRIKGPLLQCQILETALLNMVNFQSLIATKAARVCAAACGDPVLEFGLRRAQGIDGGLAASRAAYIGGCSATSNVLAGKLFGIPVRGTHAHSWVMSFDDEQESFDAYAEAMPNNCVFLVDTYDTIEGVRRAMRTGRALRQRGYRMVGIRLDSGDMTALSLEARKLLDEAGFEEAVIVASGDLDESSIAALKEEGVPIAVWGVGTRLVTAYDDPALGGVYKLSAVRQPGRDWEHKLKCSEQAAKASTPGILQVRRFMCEKTFVGDTVYDELLGAPVDGTMIDLAGQHREHALQDDTAFEDLLVASVRGGRHVYTPPPLETVRARAGRQIASLPASTRSVEPASEYPVGMEPRLQRLKSRMIKSAQQ